MPPLPWLSGRALASGEGDRGSSPDEARLLTHSHCNSGPWVVVRSLPIKAPLPKWLYVFLHTLQLVLLASLQLYTPSSKSLSSPTHSDLLRVQFLLGVIWGWMRRMRASQGHHACSSSRGATSSDGVRRVMVGDGGVRAVGAISRLSDFGQSFGTGD